MSSFKGQVVPNVDWIQNYSEKDQIENVPSAIDANNNVYVTGYAIVSGSVDYTTLKYDPSGTLLWSKHYNGTALGIDKGKAITLDNSGNVYVTGESEGIGSGRDYVTVKYDANGTEIWSARYNGSANGNDEALALTVDNNGNVYVTGESEGVGTGYDYVTIKYNASGTQTWLKRHNGTANGNDQAVAIVKGSGNRLFITGTVFNNGSGKDIETIRYNSNNGSVSWVNTKNGTANQNDVGYDLITNGANVIIAGAVFQLATNKDYYIAKINGNNGSIVNEVTYNQGDDDFATDLVVDGSGNIVVAGIAKNGVTYEYHTVNYSNTLSLQWVNKESLNQLFYRVMPTLKVDAFDHFYICGERNNNGNTNVLLYQITPNGNTSWDTEHDGTIGGDDVGVDMVMGNLGEIYLTAQTQNSNAKFDYTTIKYVLTPVYFPIDFYGEVATPLHAFYENKGQLMNTIGNTADNVLYSATYPDFNFFLHDAGVSMVFESFEQGVPTPDTIHRVDLQLIGANPNFSCYNYEDVPLKKNYYLPHLPNGVSDVKGYNRLFIPNIYQNIDLHFYNNSTGLKYYFVVKPGGNPNSIRLAFNGATSTSLNGSNDLEINTPIGSTKFTRPKAYRITPSLNTVSVGTASWNAIGNDLYNFNLPNYNTNLPLIIQVDQGIATTTAKVAIGNLLWSTYYGGSNITSFEDVKNDDFGNTYITGHTAGSLFPFPLGQSFTPAYSGGFDAVVIKLNNLIEPQWMTYFGGATPLNFDADEFSRGIVVSNNGDRIYIAGQTNSSDIPIVDGGGAYFSDNINACSGTACFDAFIARFEANGASPGDPGLGCVNSNNLPVINGFSASFSAEDFILKLDRHIPGNNATILNASYFGGGADEGLGIAFAYSDVSIAVRNDGFVFLSGNTRSDLADSGILLPLPTSQPLNFYAVEDIADGVASGLKQKDAFIAAFDPNFNLVWTTYFGGERADGGSSISISESDNRLYFVGNTQTNNTNLVAGEIALPMVEFDDTTGSSDYFQNQPVSPAPNPSWAAMFDLSGIEIPTPPTGLEEQSTTGSILLYPNPNNGSFTLTGVENITYVEIIDLSGKLVKRITVNNTQANLNLQAIETGIYFATVYTATGKSSIKFIKQ